MMGSARVLLVAVVVGAGVVGHATRDTPGPTQFAQTGGGSSSGGNSNSSSNGSSGNSNSNANDGSSNSSSNNSSNNNDGSSGNASSNSNSNSGSDRNGGTPVAPTSGTPATPAPGAPVPGAPGTTIAPNRVKAARPATCPDNAAGGTRCYRIEVKGNPQGVRLPDGQVVALPVGPTVNVDTGASTSNDVDQVVVINNDNRVVSREPVESRVRQWLLATFGLLVLVIVAAGVGAAIFRAGLRQGRDKT